MTEGDNTVVTFPRAQLCRFPNEEDCVLPLSYVIRIFEKEYGRSIDKAPTMCQTACHWDACFIILHLFSAKKILDPEPLGRSLKRSKNRMHTLRLEVLETTSVSETVNSP